MGWKREVRGDRERESMGEVRGDRERAGVGEWTSDMRMPMYKWHQTDVVRGREICFRCSTIID